MPWLNGSHLPFMIPLGRRLGKTGRSCSRLGWLDGLCWVSSSQLGYLAGRLLRIALPKGPLLPLFSSIDKVVVELLNTALGPVLGHLPAFIFLVSLYGTVVAESIGQGGDVGRAGLAALSCLR